MPTELYCREDRRRGVTREQNREAGPDAAPWNGIDYVEPGSDCMSLDLYFLCDIPRELLPRRPRDEARVVRHFRIEGGRRVRTLPVASVAQRKQSDGRAYLRLTLACKGDASEYVLRIVDLDNGDLPTDAPLCSLDPRQSEFTFRFFSDRGGDCKSLEQPPATPEGDPAINYLAKDYASFRKLMFDRLALLAPDWRERRAADLGVTLVELLAYAGDRLSYYQDAVATEAYLHTARRRVSVRRHARLVDYRLHEGYNARAYVHVAVAQDIPDTPADELYFITDPGLGDTVQAITQDALRSPAARRYEVFEPLVAPAESTLLTEADLKYPVRLVLRMSDAAKRRKRRTLRRAGQALAALLYGALSCRTQREVDQLAGQKRGFPSDSLLRRMVRELNELLQSGPLWERPEIADLWNDAVGARTKRQIGEHRRDDCPVLANRLFLADVLPTEFAQPMGLGPYLRFYAAHSELHFYTWDDRECCLPQGATRAFLEDAFVPPLDKQGASPCGDLRPFHRRKRNLRQLSPGDILIFEEQLGPRTGSSADADPGRRHAVRLTKVNFDLDTLHNRPLVEIEWDADDALPFPLCISATTMHGAFRENVSVALGNIVAVDHGRRVQGEKLADAPDTDDACCEGKCRQPAAPPRYVPYRPPLAQPHLVHAENIAGNASAAQIMKQDARFAMPDVVVLDAPIVSASGGDAKAGADRFAFAPPAPFGSQSLVSDNAVLPESKNLDLASLETALWGRISQESWSVVRERAETAASPSDAAVPSNAAEWWPAVLSELKRNSTWTPRLDLLECGPADRCFAAEMEENRTARLRFGDGRQGRRPGPGSAYFASYRVAAPRAGDIGAGAINRIVFRDTSGWSVNEVRNPLPAAPGAPPQSLDEARLFAPHAIRELQRAVAEEDYALLVERDFAARVQNARSAMRWSGAGYEVTVAVDPFAAETDVPGLIAEIERRVERYRRMGHEVRVQLAEYVPLDIALDVCLLPGYVFEQVLRDLLAAFGKGVTPDGKLAFFHPDNLKFGEGVHLSRLVAAAKAVAGVENVVVTKLQRLFEPKGSEKALDEGVLRLERLEIARVDNDLDFPELGRITFCRRNP